MKYQPMQLLGALLLSTSIAGADTITIVNPGFEDLYLNGNLPANFAGVVPPTAFPVGAAPNGWSAFGAVGNGASIGVLNPGTLADDNGTYYPDGASEGHNVAITFFNQSAGGPEFGIEQTLAAPLQSDTAYTLSVQVGNIASGVSTVEPYQSFGFFDLRGFPGYRIDLLAGDTVIASDPNTLLPAEGAFELSQTTVFIDDTHAQLGQDLTIRLVNLNNQDVDDPVVDLEVNFDNVRLESTAIPPGDANLDGVVDVADLGIVGANWLLQGTTRMQGDFNGDLVVNVADLGILSANWSDSQSLTFDQAAEQASLSALIPEPGCLALWGIGSICLGLRPVSPSRS